MVFLTWYGLYECIVMLMGLINVIEIFTGIINYLFIDILDKGVVVFLDSIY